MPDVNGKLQLQDYDNALVNRGFEGFVQQDRYQMINFGYRYVARKFPFTWQETSQQYTINPGSYLIPASGGVPLSIRHVKAVEMISDPYRQQLRPEKEEDFKMRWLDLDLTAQQNRATPFRYAVWSGQLYLLPPPQVTVTVQVWFRQFLADMVNPTDAPVTPQIFDEVILDAALVRAHRRAHELQLAQDAQMRVSEALDDMLAEDLFLEEELQERVLPDNQWL